MEEIQEIQKEESDDERDSESSKEEKGDVTRIPEPTRKHIFLLMYH